MKRRDLIAMTDGEVTEYLQANRTLIIATVGADGRPHLAPVFYGFVDGAPATATYAKSQKVRNIERDPRVTCLVESGTGYDDLRGVTLIGTATLIDDWETVFSVGRQVQERYGGYYAEAEHRALLEHTLKKRVVVRITIDSVVSWDHSKLEGAF